jgi:dienelactone hydrolase
LEVARSVPLVEKPASVAFTGVFDSIGLSKKKDFTRATEKQEDRIMRMQSFPVSSRRSFLAIGLSTGMMQAREQITYPIISEDVCPLQRITPPAKDGFSGMGFLRKPPASGRFPVFMIILPGGSNWPEEQLKTYSLTTPTPSRFLAAGYVIAAMTLGSSSLPGKTTPAVNFFVAAVDYLKGLPFVDPRSIIVYGCSGGGNLALEVAAATDICALVPEEPASMGFTGVFDSTGLSKKKDFTPADAAFIHQDPKRYYTPDDQKLTRPKIDRIRCPILIIQGDVQPINRFNAQVLIPELRSAGKALEVITYPGGVHCFCTQGGDLVDGRTGRWRSNPPAPWTMQEAAALKAFHDIDSFCKRHVPTQPKPMDPSLVKLLPLTTE